MQPCASATTPACGPRLDAVRERFRAFEQDHVFRFWDWLDVDARARLLTQAARIDLTALRSAYEAASRLKLPGARRLEPLPIRRLPRHGGPDHDLGSARALGEARIREGRVGVLVVAGGQGTRLGFDGPKGAFPVGPLTPRSLFELQAQKIRGHARRYGRSLPWYVMTSSATDAETRALFRSRGWFGLDPQDVFFFCQQMVPSVDFEGRLMLEETHRIAESPGGHGGVVTALDASGALDDMERRGIDLLAYYQVDNPLVRIADPTYLGLHLAAESEMSCKVIAKRDPFDRVGHVARVDGSVGVVEYTEIAAEHRDARGPDGELVFWAGSIAIHVFDTAFLRRCAADAERILPWHASPKKIPCVDEAGARVRPDAPNGLKLERFVFDALPAARRTLVVETLREDEYEPIKNASGSESPQTARRALVSLYRRWLLEAGLETPPDAAIEIDHSRFDGPEDFRASGIQRIAEAGDAIRLAPGAIG
ncbi:MAG TPA: UDPGP type 1 family protein [Myxococcota bacterium]|nr:UDPGP type 1 family protein [Myxococcota bacterium]